MYLQGRFDATGFCYPQLPRSMRTLCLSCPSCGQVAGGLGVEISHKNGINGSLSRKTNGRISDYVENVSVSFHDQLCSLQQHVLFTCRNDDCSTQSAPCLLVGRTGSSTFRRHRLPGSNGLFFLGRRFDCAVLRRGVELNLGGFDCLWLPLGCFRLP